MRNFLVALLLLSSFAGSSVTVSAGEDVEKLRAKLKAVQKQLDDLRRQETELAKQLDDAERELAKRQEPYVKVEIRGTLREERHLVTTTGPKNLWIISAAQASWIVDFRAYKDLPKIAEKHRGKVVIITGRLERQFTGRTFGDGKESVLVVETMKPALP